jgi:hypothetical protein
MNSHRIERGKNLRGELTRRGHDQCSCFPAGFVDEIVKNRQNERRGLSASSHRARENISALECGWYCLSLNWSRSLEAQLFETFVKAGVEL